jgi:hypothetical protein
LFDVSGRAWIASWRLLALALVLPLALSSALPSFARMLGDSSATACACHMSRDRVHCDCPMCSHGPADRRLMAIGQCTDHEPAFGGSVGLAVPPPAGGLLVATSTEAGAPPVAPAAIPDVHLTPPTPPPRRA